jgi:hypothetical protein
LAGDEGGLIIMPRLSDRLSRFLLCATVALGCSLIGRAGAQEAVLLTSTVPGYVPGMVISATDRLSVPDGASATLLFQSGEMLRLRGPFEGTLGQQKAAANGGAAMVAEMFRMQGADATVIGGTRSTSHAHSDRVLDDVEIDPQRSGTYCIEPATSVWITRPVNPASAYALRRKGSSRALAWPGDAQRIEWPSDVPIDDGSQFEITTAGSALATVTFHAVPDVTGEARIASGLILGCRYQFDSELKRLARSTAAPELWMTTDHGRRPEYRAGEPIVLTVMSNLDGYLYCFTIGDGGHVKALFPAGAIDGAQVPGSAPLLVPGRRQPAGLTASAGTAEIRCWLADRDITPELPHALLGAPAARSPDQFTGDLNALFVRIDGTRIVTDTIMLRTE